MEMYKMESCNPQQPNKNETGNGQNNSVITVVRDPNHTLGKKFTLNPDDIISKKAAVSISIGIAVMYLVNTFNDLAALLKKIGDDPHAAIINAFFPGIQVGEEFLILSEREIERRTGIPRTDRRQQKGIHNIKYNGQEYKAVGRFKENVRPSCWQYFDRDIDRHTPKQFANQSFEEWFSCLGEIVPGLADVSWCRIDSTSARVFRDGKPVGSGNGHLWFKVSDPADIERFRTAILLAAAKADLTWQKPRFSRKEPGTVVGHSLTTIIDPSIFTPGRLTFIGQPVVSDGLTVEPLTASTRVGLKSLVDTSLVVLPDVKNIREITRKAGITMEVSHGNHGLRITANDLTLDTELETEGQGLLTLREIVESGISGKIRCQTPFRDSSSFAAFVSTGKDGDPFVYDVGTGITHWFNESEKDDLQLLRAKGAVSSLLEKAKTDSAAPLEPEAIKALAIVKKTDEAEFFRIRGELKKSNREISLTTLDNTIKSVPVEGEIGRTHHGYARDLIANKLTVENWLPAGHQGSLYVLDPENNIWVRKSSEELIRLVAENYDGSDNCKRIADYRGIAEHSIMLATDHDFFTEAPEGLACPDGFYQIMDGEISVEPLSPSHRQRVKIDVTPKEVETPLFDKFLHETFQTSVEGEEEQQLTLVQEIVGSIMLGIMARHQKAVLFYDPYGRAGKGTLERIIRELVPSSFRTAVNPFRWENEYYLASLIGSRFNTVGELPDSKPIPAAAFKTVTGGDLLTGRHPTHRPFTFINEAAHLFMSNHLIHTKDHTEAFFTRWLIVEFPNSRLHKKLQIDPDLPEKIIKNELPGIAFWALTGGMRLMENGSFSDSIVHDRLMEKWRYSTNSLEEFIHECCDLDASENVRRADFYRDYRNWCDENGRKAFAKGKVKDLLSSNIGLRITHTVLDGYEIFRGVKMKEQHTPNGINPDFINQYDRAEK
jgi:putative DNA primase/helicase